MLKENSLRFDERNLFNSEILHQYDADGQKGFLGYLLRKANWRITDNQILFQEIQTDEQIEQLLKYYDTDTMKSNLEIKKDILDKVMVLGFSRVKDIVDNEGKEIESRENKTEKFER